LLRQAFTLILAFIGGFLAVGAWIWAPQITNAATSLVSGAPSVSLFADANRIGRPEIAPVVRGCVAKVLDLGPDQKLEPSAMYFVLKNGGMQANVGAMLGKANRDTESQTINLAAKWGELANCIFAQEDRELCNADNRAAAVESATKFFAYAKQAEAAKSTISADEVRAFENFSDRLLLMLKNHRRYGTLVAADFSSFASPEITKIMREEKQTRDICKR
jgi:hypothetical protein